MNHRGNPDTLTLDPLVTYRLTVHTIPPAYKDTFKLIPGKHSIIALDAPQGYLIIKPGNGLQAKNISCIIRKAGDMNTLNYQEVNRTEKYIVGKYDIEIPVLPKILLYNIEVSQSSTTTVQIPPAGMVTFLMIAPGYGSVYLRENGKDLKWVYNLSSTTKSESLTLQAGSYTIVYRAMNAKQTLYTISKTFDIQAGSSKVIELN
jgi:Ca-activated chloride channel family protein